jgi:hypothetical protein
LTLHTDNQVEIRRFLLGTLSKDARQKVEERLMTEEAFLDEVTLAEGELMDDYVGGLLDDAERAEFERYFLTEERRQQLSFARALARHVAVHTPAVSPAEDAAETDVAPEPLPRTTPTFVERLRAFWGGLSAAPRAGLALACVAVIVGALWPARPPAPPSPGDFMVREDLTKYPMLTLAPAADDRATGSKPQTGRLPLGAFALRLVLTLPAGSSPAAGYRAELQPLPGLVDTEAVRVVGHGERSVTALVPEARLARGRYAVRLYAVTADKPDTLLDTYLFNIE